MLHEKESAPGVEVGRASVREHDGSIPQAEWERGMRLLWVPFAALIVLYMLWEAMLPCLS